MKFVELTLVLFLNLSSKITSNEDYEYNSKLCGKNHSNHQYEYSCSNSKKIIIITQNILVPTQLGSDKRAVQLISILKELKQIIYVFALSMPPDLPNQQDQEIVNKLNVEIDNKTLLRSKTLVTTYREILRSIEPDIVMMWLWFWTLDFTAPGILLRPTRAVSPNIKLVILTDDVHSKREQQLAQQQQTSDRYDRVMKRRTQIVDILSYCSEAKLSLVSYYSKMKVAEEEIYMNCDLIVCISEADRKDVLLLDSTATLTQEDKVYSLRYVIDQTETINSSGITSTIGGKGSFESRKGFIFIGNGGNPTNILAIRWYVDSVAPKLDLLLPGIKLYCIGNYWQSFVKNVPQASQYVVFSGYLTEEEMIAKMDEARVFVSPIVASTGINTKNVLALTRGIPLVTMPSGSKGLCSHCDDVLVGNPFDPFAKVEEPSSQELPMLVGRSLSDFVQKIYRLYTNKEDWTIYSVAGPPHVKIWFGFQEGAADMNKILFRLYNPIISSSSSSRTKNSFSYDHIIRLKSNDSYVINIRKKNRRKRIRNKQNLKELII